MLQILYPKGIILNKHNIDNQAVTHYFNFIFKGYQYIYRTPLHFAAYYDRKEVVKILIENGEDKNTKTGIDVTPLIAAAEQGKKEIVKILLKNKADKTIKSVKSKTALDYAKEKGYEDIVRILS